MIVPGCHSQGSGFWCPRCCELYSDGIISVQAPEPRVLFKVRDTQKSWDQPTGCEIIGSNLRVLGKKFRKSGEKKKEKLKQIEAINHEPLSDQPELADGAGTLCKRLGSLPIPPAIALFSYMLTLHTQIYSSSKITYFHWSEHSSSSDLASFSAPLVCLHSR